MEAAVAAQRGGNVRSVALNLQHARLEREMKKALARLIGSSAFSLGVEVERFEAEFAEYSQARHCVGVASGTLFPARFADRDAAAGALNACGIETGVHFSPAVHAHPAWRKDGPRHGKLPDAETWAAEKLLRPMHPDLRSDEIERVADAIHAAIRTPNARAGANRC